MDALEELGEINKKAAKFLHFHGFDEKQIEKMMQDMEDTHPSEHSIAESREIFENILKDPSLIDRIKSLIKKEAEFYIKYELDQGGSLFPLLMHEEDIIKQLEKSRFNDENALMAWFYRLFPRYTLQQITAYHRQALTAINQNNFGKLKETERSKIVRIAELVIEYHDFDVKNRLDEMVQDLLVKALHVPEDNKNITPQFCRSVLLDVDVDDLKLRVENEFKAPRNVVKDKHIIRAYRILQMKNICNRAHKIVPFPDRTLLQQQVFFDYNERYKFSQLRDRINQYCDEIECSNVAGRAGNVADAPKPGTSGVQQTKRDKPNVSKRDERKIPGSSKTQTSPNRKTITYVLVDEGPLMRKVEVSISPTKSSPSPTKSSPSPTKSSTLPTKSSTSPTKSTSSPTKSTTSPTKSTTSPSIPMRSPPIRLRSPPIPMHSPPIRLRSPPITIRSSPTTMQSPKITIRSEGSNLPSTTSGQVTETSPKRRTRTPPRLIARTVPKSPPKEASKSPPKGTKRTFKSPDKEDVDHQPKKNKPSDDEIAEPQLKKPEE